MCQMCVVNQLDLNCALEAPSVQIETGAGATRQAGTLDELADYLVDGYWEDQGGDQHSFNLGASNVVYYDITALNAEGQKLALWAFEAWSMVADLDFQAAGGGNSAKMTFDDEQSGAYASYSAFGQTTVNTTINVSKGWVSAYGSRLDSYTFSTYMHEIGHALGLGHQGDYNGSATYGVNQTFDNDSLQMSLMSYFNQSENWNVDATNAQPVTAMIADILAMQTLYGAASGGVTSGNTIWGQGQNTGTYLDQLFDAMFETANSAIYGNSNIAITLFDEGGWDKLDLSSDSDAQRIDLRPEGISDVLGLDGNLIIARDTLIEELTAGTGNDDITGNSADNSIVGGLGNDTIRGLDGADTLLGGDGLDVLEGGSAADLLQGGAGTDTISGGTGADSLYGNDGDDEIYGNTGVDWINAGAGNDYVSAGNGVDVVYGDAGNDDIIGRSGWDTLYGGTGDDTLRGSSGDDHLYGDDGADQLEGGSAKDSLFGGGGDDILYGNFGNDDLSGGAGNDTAYGGSAWDTLAGGDGDDTLYGNEGSDLLQGDGDDDVLMGGSGDDQLLGGAGNDTLQGNQGIDQLSGGTGDDTLRGGTLADTFVFALGDGADTIEDFNAAEDILMLTQGLYDAATDVLSETVDEMLNVTLMFSGGQQITLLDVTDPEAIAGAIQIGTLA